MYPFVATVAVLMLAPWQQSPVVAPPDVSPAPTAVIIPPAVTTPPAPPRPVVPEANTPNVVAEPDVKRPVDAGVSAQNAPSQNETNPQWRDSVEQGLEWLAKSQNPDGSFGKGRMSGNAGIVSLCALALMGDGNLPGRGRYGAAVARALEYVLQHVSESGLVSSENMNGPMYGHGFAALFLGEIYGMSSDDARVRDALTRAIRLIENSQNDEGGWRYNPVPDDADVSVTICQVMALRSARNAGIRIPKQVIDNAVRYVRECQTQMVGFVICGHRERVVGHAQQRVSPRCSMPVCTTMIPSHAAWRMSAAPPHPMAPDRLFKRITFTVITTPPRRCISQVVIGGKPGGHVFNQS